MTATAAAPHESLNLPLHWQVPAFTHLPLREKAHDIAILIPVINEGERVRGQLQGMAAADLGGEIVIADGGSTDGSLELGFLHQTGVSALLTKTGPGRLSAQLRMGFAYCLARNYAAVVTIDGNGKDGFEAIPAFISALKEGYGFVQGSRYLAGGEHRNTPGDREWAVRLIHAPVISLAAGVKYTDTTNGFRAFSAELLSDERLAIFRNIFDTYNLHYYVSVRAPKLGYRVTELPVRRSYPRTGKTPTKIAGWQGRAHILKQLFEAATGRYDP